MKIKSLTIFIACLLLSCFAVPVLTACCLPPKKPPCYRCEDGVWVWNCGSGQGCCDGKKCYNPNTEQCCGYGTGQTCDTNKECCNGDCCNTAECKSCQNGSCQPYCNSDNCEECDGQGGCPVCGGDPFKCCKNGGCNECSAWYDDFPNYIPPCPECDDERGGCYSDAYWIQVEHSHFTGGHPPPGDVGICGTPTTNKQIGVHVYCKGYGLDIDSIIECAIEAGLDATDCLECVIGGDCWSCLQALINGGFDCVDPTLCRYVTGCRHCYDWESCSFPFSENVVDWDPNKITFCYP
jgi:hypothetical protein